MSIKKSSKAKQPVVPFNSKAFMRICKENYDLCFAKHQDYGPENIRQFGELGVVMRMWEKIQRLYNLTWKNRQPVVNDESVENVYRDICNYTIIALMLRNNEWV